MTLLEVENIHSYYGNIHALRGVSLTVEEGEVVTLIGSNGAGKTTTLRSIHGILTPREGRIAFRGEEIQGVPVHDMIGKGISQSPEGRRIFHRMTVTENLEMGAYHRKDRTETQDDMTRVFDLFPRLKERVKQEAGTMSGGEQQMLAVARSYIQNPKVVLLDEVSMGLAPNLVDEIFTFLATLKETGVALIVVEQFVHRALALSDSVVVIARGTIRLSGRSDEFGEDEIFNAYAGTNPQSLQQGASAHV